MEVLRLDGCGSSMTCDEDSRSQGRVKTTVGDDQGNNKPLDDDSIANRTHNNQSTTKL